MSSVWRRSTFHSIRGTWKSCLVNPLALQENPSVDSTVKEIRLGNVNIRSDPSRQIGQPWVPSWRAVECKYITSLCRLFEARTDCHRLLSLGESGLEGVSVKTFDFGYYFLTFRFYFADKL